MLHKVTCAVLALALCGSLQALDAAAPATAPAGGEPSVSAPAGSQAPEPVSQEALQLARRMESLARELQSLREAAQRDAATVARLREDVERARRAARTASAMVAALATVLLALLAWLGWRWNEEQRLKRVGRWFEEHGEAARAGAPGRHAAEGLETQPASILREGPPAPHEGGSAVPSASSSLGVDIDLGDPAEAPTEPPRSPR